MKRILVANRGEIAVRVIRAARALGVESVAVYSQADAASMHAWLADRAVRIGPAAAAESYLRTDRLLHVARATGCDAIHPGYGFLSENADFAEQCEREGIGFIGPAAEHIRVMGDKAAARSRVEALGVPLVPGSERAYTDVDEAAAAAEGIGFPALLKARAGGGGRGMRVAERAEGFRDLFGQARSEAQSAFGDGAIYLERYLPRIRHLEVQVFGDRHGNVRHLAERDCSVQRRHQKLLEEAPSSAIDADRRARLCEAARTIAGGIGYVGAGTVEFIYEPDSGEFFFIEMNTRIQVEHPVTEMVTGHDLVAEQIRVAGGEPLSFDDAGAPDGHAVEFRINAEDADNGFMPSPGPLRRWRPPEGEGIRFDSHVYQGYVVPPHYDSLLGKLIVHGRDRTEALARGDAALAAFEARGVSTTIPFHRRVIAHPDFVGDRVHTRWVETELGCGERRCPDRSISSTSRCATRTSACGRRA
ncbi:MAG: acetyl-CoA carboxylase biotin carboxylase subunit [Halofilum sp. (in: g-proteobacteria)]|nr:acetyl-CoA carboxylase biotin carboxylase subunit [Halofilum sp. (in: g-proteobacteria)]